MTNHWVRRFPLVVVTVLGLVAAAVTLGLTSNSSAQARAKAERHGAGHHARITRAELSFRNDMRKLWEDHIVWTRMAIVSLTTDAPDTGASVGRLLENQRHIGDAVKPFYGEAAGNELTRLLREHITIAADLIAAAKAADGAKLAAAQAAWEANADAIAEFLHGANPREWPLADLKAMLRDHLTLTTREVVARLQGDWAADVAAYDAIHRQALHMADMLSVGIIEQFPRRFR